MYFKEPVTWCVLQYLIFIMSSVECCAILFLYFFHLYSVLFLSFNWFNIFYAILFFMMPVFQTCHWYQWQFLCFSCHIYVDMFYQAWGCLPNGFYSYHININKSNALKEGVGWVHWVTTMTLQTVIFYYDPFNKELFILNRRLSRVQMLLRASQGENRKTRNKRETQQNNTSDSACSKGVDLDLGLRWIKMSSGLQWEYSHIKLSQRGFYCSLNMHKPCCLMFVLCYFKNKKTN